MDAYSDPRHESGYSAHDLISLGFVTSPQHAALLKATKPIAQVDLSGLDAVFVAGGQRPMVSFIDNEPLQRFVADAYEAGKVGFANSEEGYADSFVGRRIQPFWIEDEARKLEGTNFVVDQKFRAFAVRDGRLVTGQPRCSGAAAARG